MEVEKRIGYYSKANYIHITSDEGEFIVDEEIGAAYVVEPEVGYGSDLIIEFETHQDEIAEVYKVIETISFNQLNEMLGGIL